MADSNSDSSTAAGGGSVASQGEQMPILYEMVEPFTREKFAKLGLKRIKRPFGFAAKARAVPVTVTEFGMACHSFPIVFAGGAQPMPVAVLGLGKEENLFVEKDGDWARYMYIPAYIRRYPFILASDEQEEGRMTLCIASDAAMVGENPEHPFFENGELTQFTNDAFEFCKTMQQQLDNTRRFMAMLSDMELLTQRDATFTPPGADKPQPLATFIAVDEEKLNALPTDKWEELRKSGALSAIYAHLLSFANWQGLTMRNADR